AHARADRLRVRARALLLAAGVAGAGNRLPGLEPAGRRRELLRHGGLARELRVPRLDRDLVHPGPGAGERTRERARAGTRPGARDVSLGAGGVGPAILDAGGDGWFHEPRAVAALGGEHVGATR